MNNPVKNIIIIASAVFVLVFVLISADRYSVSSSKSTEVCLSCHEDENLTMEKDGKKISLYVNPSEYKNSVHAGAECNDCHTGYNPDELPHSKSSQKVNCGSCHDDTKGIESSVHANVNCADCHSKHGIKSAKDLAKDQTESCLGCHKSKNIRQFTTSVHNKKNTGCDGCHNGGHAVKKIQKQEVTAVCGKCHAESKMKFSNSIHHTLTKSGNKNSPLCTDCHGSHQILTSKHSIQSEACLDCHLNEKMFPGDSKGSAKFVAEYKTSIHAGLKGEMEAAGCVDCHGNHMIQDPNDPGSSVSRYKLTETCAKCHSEIAEEFKKSSHGKALDEKNISAPTCVSCHSEHSIKSVPFSNELSKLNQVETCLKCHQEGKLPHKNYKGEEELISNYKDSHHYKALQEGKFNAATCSDCHGAHSMIKFDDPNSHVYKKNIAMTCGKSNCHVKELAEFQGSVHNVSNVKNQNSDAPTCTNCHGNHQILEKDETGNRIASSKGLIQLCSDCHNSVELNEKYDLPTGRTSSYLDSYHGLAVRGGSKLAADCGSCHGNHDIRASKDSTSSINKNNLAKTCGNCHPGVEETFFQTKIHIVDKRADAPGVWWVTLIYLILIFGTIGAMILHNILDIRKKAIEKQTE